MGIVCSKVGTLMFLRNAMQYQRTVVNWLHSFACSCLRLVTRQIPISACFLFLIQHVPIDENLKFDDSISFVNQNKVHVRICCFTGYMEQQFGWGDFWVFSLCWRLPPLFCGPLSNSRQNSIQTWSFRAVWTTFLRWPRYWVDTSRTTSLTCSSLSLSPSFISKLSPFLDHSFW